MIPQDIAMGICSVIFFFALFPQVQSDWQKKKTGVKLSTSLITYSALVGVAVSLATLGCLFSATIVFATSILWGILAAIKMYY